MCVHVWWDGRFGQRGKIILGLWGPQQDDFEESGLLQFTDFPETQPWQKCKPRKKMSREC